MKARTWLVVSLIFGISGAGAFYFWSKWQQNTPSPSVITENKNTGKKTKVKKNPHFNLAKLQYIIANDSLSRKQKAQMIHTLGSQLMVKNRFGEAIDYFGFALDYDNTHLASWHNLAVALLKEDPDCRMMNAFEAILMEFRLDPTKKTLIENDKDLVLLRSKNALPILFNGFPQNDSLLKIMLIGRWYKSNSKDYLANIHFGSNTQGDQTVVDSSGKVQHKYFGYYMKERIITMTFTEDTTKIDKLKLLIDYDSDRMIMLREMDGAGEWSEFNSCGY
jgi:hypothetical protein